ncbi:PLP-dependent aminotransferase family protein [Erwinia sp. JUb26]|uniref:MocR-like pyridoxine biosynthesis transcription factor PdxR n=1 Tax=Erwinia sp. JUb26 TaxID=2485126 RepID=UPI000F4711BB|nr:PLP-dependent aminotransferase family protein [Erwinia sp. JUb26]
MPGIDKNSGPSAVQTAEQIGLQRYADRSLTEQIRAGMAQAIAEGRVPAGSRVPSCRDLAAALGVARGTVRNAYDMLVDSQLLVARGAAGTWVSAVLPASRVIPPKAPVLAPLADVVHAFDVAPLTFQMGTPASDAFPAKVWSRILARHVREIAGGTTGYADPRGSLMLRQELVSYLSLARGIRCQASQVIITNGYTGALGIIFLALGLRGARAWSEDPGYLLARRALGLAGIEAVPVPVDEQGMSVADGLRLAADARVALVTPGQQSPLGVTLSLARRGELLAWARQQDSWIIEDDYLGELQLQGRAAPALAALDAERVLHIGTFSKTLSPALRMGYLVVPDALAAHFAETVALLAPASSSVLHNAVAEFLHDGHYMRHLRRMKRLYAARLTELLQALEPHFSSLSRAALAVVIRLPQGTRDVQIAQAALAHGMAPSPLSVWYQDKTASCGLVLGVTNLPDGGFAASAARLKALVEAFG